MDRGYWQHIRNQAIISILAGKAANANNRYALLNRDDIKKSIATAESLIKVLDTTCPPQPVDWEQRRWAAALTILNGKAANNDLPNEWSADRWANDVFLVADTLVKRFQKAEIGGQEQAEPDEQAAKNDKPSQKTAEDKQEQDKPEKQAVEKEKTSQKIAEDDGGIVRLFYEWQIDRRWEAILEMIYKQVSEGSIPEGFREDKGFILLNDEYGYSLAKLRRCLHYDELQDKGLVNEVVIDTSWTPYIMSADAVECWNRLVKEAYKVRDGLLVLTVSNIQMFGLCWQLKQFAKQERKLEAWIEINELFDKAAGFVNMEYLEKKKELMRYNGDSKKEIEDYTNRSKDEAKELGLIPSKFRFNGYVLIVVKDLSWQEIKDYACDKNPGNFDAMMTYYRKINIE